MLRKFTSKYTAKQPTKEPRVQTMKQIHSYFPDEVLWNAIDLFNKYSTVKLVKETPQKEKRVSSQSLSTKLNNKNRTDVSRL